MDCSVTIIRESGKTKEFALKEPNAALTLFQIVESNRAAFAPDVVEVVLRLGSKTADVKPSNV